MAAEMKFTRKTQLEALERITAVEKTVKLPKRRPPLLSNTLLSNNSSVSHPRSGCERPKPSTTTPTLQRVPSVTSCPPSPSLSSLSMEDLDALLGNDHVDELPSDMLIDESSNVPSLQPAYPPSPSLNLSSNALDSLPADGLMQTALPLHMFVRRVWQPNLEVILPVTLPYNVPRFRLPSLSALFYIALALAGYFILGVLYLDVVSLDDLHYDILEGFRRRVP